METNGRSPVNSPHKGQWRGALMFSLICVWINGWVNNREAGDLRRYRTHYDVIVMMTIDAKAWMKYCLQKNIWHAITYPCHNPPQFNPLFRRQGTSRKRSLMEVLLHRICAQHIMMSSNGNLFGVTGPFCGEFSGHPQRPVTWNFDVFFDLCLNKRLGKQSWGWWVETPSRPCWRHSNKTILIHSNV